MTDTLQPATHNLTAHMSTQSAGQGTSPSPDVLGVELIGLEQRYGTHIALRSLSLSIAEGEFFSLIGPSGCGKTTTLRLVSGLDIPSAGKIIVRGRELTGVPAHKRPVSTVFQTYALFPHLSVAQNVAFGLQERRVPRREIGKRVDLMLELVRLDARADAKPTQLSGGQQQRVALARALVLEPEVLLLDEPLGALDLKLRKEMQELIRVVHQETGHTFLYVTHDQDEAFAMSDRVGVMSDGELQQVATPEEIYTRPATPFVAGFVGAANRFSGEIVRIERCGRYQVRTDVGSLLIRGCGPDSLAVGARVIAVIRPESIDAARERPTPSPDNCARAYVRRIQYLGSATRYELETDTTLSVLVDTGRRGERLLIGETAVLGWSQNDTWLISATAAARAREADDQYDSRPTRHEQ